MRIAVITITRDRLEYTKRTFASLRQKAGCSFKHYVFDNGSEDGTFEWIQEYAVPWEERDEFWWVRSEVNSGIGNAWKDMVGRALYYGADVIVKADNDCLVKSDYILSTLSALFGVLQARGEKWVLSPRVEGIVHQPRRTGEVLVGTSSVRDGYAVEERTCRIGETGMVGGLFLAAPAELYREYSWPTGLPKARGWDSALCAWARAHGWRTGYVEDLVVEHVDGTDAQALKYPEYFARKRREEVER